MSRPSFQICATIGCSEGLVERSGEMDETPKKTYTMQESIARVEADIEQLNARFPNLQFVLAGGQVRAIPKRLNSDKKQNI